MMHKITEDFLDYIWRHKLFNFQQLKTGEGELIDIFNVGQKNRHAGPDYFDARIQIGNTLWAGNVELHVKASDWFLHQHQYDSAYDNVILHVVYENDRSIVRKNGQKISTLVLKSRIRKSLFENYQSLRTHPADWVPCEKHLKEVSDLVWMSWLDRLGIERLEEKTAPIIERLKVLKNHWEQLVFELMAESFGNKVNRAAFIELAQSIPFSVLQKYQSSLFQLEALLFGQAGLIPETSTEDYPKQLLQEYLFLKHKHDLKPMQINRWQFMRLRPPNFPTIRIAQLAALFHQKTHFLATLLATNSLERLRHFLSVKASPYWDDHYTFQKQANGPAKAKVLGKMGVLQVIINAVIPLFFIYGKQLDQASYQEKGRRFLTALPKEKNRIIQQWEAMGKEVQNAADSQALLQLKNNYCDLKACLNCRIGHHLLSELD